MHVLKLNEDNIVHILYDVDIVAFICFLTTCKQLYNMRKACLKFFTKNNQFQAYNKAALIPTYLDCYVDLYSHATCWKIITLPQVPDNIDEKKARNTLSLVAFECDADMFIFQEQKRYTYLLQLCCKTVCSKFGYTYADKPYGKLYSLFWNAWYKSHICIMDICAIAYHIKNRKYKNLLNCLISLEFRKLSIEYLFDTLQFIINYAEVQLDAKYKAVLIYLIYAFVNKNFDTFSTLACFNGKFQDTLYVKAYEFTERIGRMHYYPKYIRTHLTNEILHTVNLIDK